MLHVRAPPLMTVLRASLKLSAEMKKVYKQQKKEDPHWIFLFSYHLFLENINRFNDDIFHWAVSLPDFHFSDGIYDIHPFDYMAEHRMLAV